MDDNNNIPIIRNLVLVGGGHTHVFVLKRFGMKPMPGLQITLICRDINAPYSGMIPAHIAGHYTKEQCHIDLTKLARFGNIRFIHAEVCGINTELKKIYMNDGRPPIKYDILSIDIGSTPTLPRYLHLDDKIDHEDLIDEEDELTKLYLKSTLTPVKPIDGLSERWKILRTKIINGNFNNINKKIQIIVVGAGAAGVEMILSIQYRLKTLLNEKNIDSNNYIEYTLCVHGNTILPSHNKKVQKIMSRILNERNIKILYNTHIIGIAPRISNNDKNDEENEKNDDDEKNNDEKNDNNNNNNLFYSKSYDKNLLHGGILISNNNKKIIYDECIWCTSAAAQEWLKDTNLELDNKGFILLNDYLESINTPGVFACGDISHMVNSPRPKAGVFAVRMGPPLEKNIRNILLGKKMIKFTPQKTFLSLISCGNKYAVASKSILAAEGEYLWKLKDYIDVKFMLLFQELPEMKINKKPSDLFLLNGKKTINIYEESLMRCRGCGSKIGASILSKVLSKIDIPTNSTVISGLNSPDDSAIIKNAPNGYVYVQSVDYFATCINDPYLFGKISINHALSDIYAMGAKPVSALAIAVVPYGSPDKIEDTLYQMMSGACSILKKINCALIGGHSTEGNEMSLGFSINGIVKEDEVIKKSGAKNDNILILTKPIGTGYLFASEMRGKAEGIWIENALNNMNISNDISSDIFKKYNTSSVTDITGFGLIGHLIEILDSTKKENHFNRNNNIDNNNIILEEKKDNNNSNDDDDDDDDDDIVCEVYNKEDILRAEINLNNIPILDGAINCFKQNIQSSLYPENYKNNFTVYNHNELKNNEIYRLLFDPQTSGGLLGCIPKDNAEECLNELIEAGYKDAAIIGKIVSNFKNINEDKIPSDDEIIYCYK